MTIENHKLNLVRIFNQLSEIEYKKGRTFPSIAFRKVANIIKSGISYEYKDSRVIISDGNKLEVLGQSSSDIFKEFILSNKSSRLNSELHYLIDTTDLMNVSGIGESKSQILIKAGYSNAKDLKELNLNIGDLIPGTNITYSRNIDTGLRFYLATGNKRIGRDLALEYLKDFKSYLLKKNFGHYEIYPVGSYRRLKSTVGDIDIILVSKTEKSDNIFEEVSKWFDSTLVHGSTKVAGVKGSTQIDVRLIDRKYLGAHILHGTGSQDFNIKLRSLAKSRGLRLNEYGIVDANGKFITFESEKDVFKYLEIPFVEPWKR
jgi:DNA polymerase (family 10)